MDEASCHVERFVEKPKVGFASSLRPWPCPKALHVNLQNMGVENSRLAPMQLKMLEHDLCHTWVYVSATAQLHLCPFQGGGCTTSQSACLCAQSLHSMALLTTHICSASTATACRVFISLHGPPFLFLAPDLHLHEKPCHGPSCALHQHISRMLSLPAHLVNTNFPIL